MFDFVVSKYIKNKNNLTDTAIRQLYGKLSGGVGIFCNLLLFVLKLVAGIITGAVSVLADAFNNLSDAASSIVTLVGFHMAGKPADSEHPFGHGRIEYISGMFVSFVIIIMGYELLKSSVAKIIH
ncbi:MAG: cation diffusion facilitator family transporter, partial [Clostridia bacterium]|nr:cation diffusion facilitator family transporter [Clostridia bacterium]